MSFCFLYNVVLENHSVQNSPWGEGGLLPAQGLNPSMTLAILLSAKAKIALKSQEIPRKTTYQSLFCES